VEEEDVIWNNFCNWNFFWSSMDFELFTRFQIKSSLTRFVLIKAYCSIHCKSTRALFYTRSPPWWYTRFVLSTIWHEWPTTHNLRRYWISKHAICEAKVGKRLKTEQLEELRVLPQIHLNSNLDKVCSQVVYKPCPTILGGMHNLATKIWEDTTLQT
jgi:hypothetical protein